MYSKRFFLEIFISAMLKIRKFYGFIKHINSSKNFESEIPIYEFMQGKIFQGLSFTSF